MKDNAPVWIQVVGLFVPLVVALIAGTFAISNSTGRGIERLKNLVELHSDFPPELNPNSTLERIMLRELEAIDLATAWGYRFFRRWLILSACWTLAFGAMAIAAHRLHWVVTFWIAFGLYCLGGVSITALYIWSQLQMRKFGRIYDPYYEALLNSPQTGESQA
jgi:hypothetical protein